MDTTTSQCIRDFSNSTLETPLPAAYRFDSNEFDPQLLLKTMQTYSFKLNALLDNIKKQDDADFVRENKHFKHVIYSTGRHEMAKLVVSALVASGLHFGMQFDALTSSEADVEPGDEIISNRPATGTGVRDEQRLMNYYLKEPTKLLETKFTNFYFLTSGTVFGNLLNDPIQKEMVDRFNDLSVNAHGETVRFLILEDDDWIDDGNASSQHPRPRPRRRTTSSSSMRNMQLLGVKYVHVFEPFHSFHHEKKVLGVHLNPRRQNKKFEIELNPMRVHYKPPQLNIFIYDMMMSSSPPRGNEEAQHPQQSTSVFAYYLQRLGFDVDKNTFLYELDKMTIRGAVDRPLTENIIAKNLAGVDMNSTFSAVREQAKEEEGKEGEGGPPVEREESPAVAAAGADEADGVVVEMSSAAADDPFSHRTTPQVKGGWKVSQKPIRQWNNKSVKQWADASVDYDPKPTTHYMEKLKRPLHRELRDTVINLYKGDERYDWSLFSSAASTPPPATPTETPLPVTPAAAPTEEEEKDPGASPATSLISAISAMIQRSSSFAKQTVPTILGYGSKNKDNSFNLTKTLTQVQRATPTQNFLANYFVPSNPCRGMLLYHSPGTGKTCSALNIASSSFAKEGYRVIWVTDDSMKSTIWENNDTIWRSCNIDQQQQVMLHTVTTADWWRLVAGKGKLYKQLFAAAKNIHHHNDFLYKTLVIFENAHNLLLQRNERRRKQVRVEELHRALMKSYRYGGTDSARILLLTSTPVLEDPMDLIQLLNLCKPPESQMPSHYSEFQKAYLFPTGKFTTAGEERYLDDIAGYVSYLNRFHPQSKVAVSTEPPLFTTINVPVIRDFSDIDKFDSVYVRQYVNSGIIDLKKAILDQTAQIDQRLNYLESPASYDSFIRDKIVDLPTEDEKSVATLIIRKTVSDLIADVKLYSAKVRESVASLKSLTNNKFLFQRKELQRLKEMSQWDEEEYREFQKSPYYKIRYKCGDVVLTNMASSGRQQGSASSPPNDHVSDGVGSLHGDDEQLTQMRADIARINEVVDELHTEFKQQTIAYNSSVRAINHALSRTGLTPAERDGLITQMNEEKKFMRLALRDRERKGRSLARTKKGYEMQLRRTQRNRALETQMLDKDVREEIGAAKQKLERLQSELLSKSMLLDAKFKELLDAHTETGDDAREVVFGILGMQ